MSRDLAPDDPRPERATGPLERAIPERERETAERPSGAPARVPQRPREVSRPPIQFVDGRTVLYDRDRGYALTQTQILSVAELGKFRVIAAEDLARYLYSGDRDKAQHDTAGLVRQGLVRKGVFEGPEAMPRELLTLTRRGHRLLGANALVQHSQAIYHGFVKPKEANHDAELYRLFQKEAQRVEQQGAKNLRVILDYELKRKINRDMARFGASARPQIAERHGLRVVRNKIPIPDLRIEYETPAGDIARVDLELVTEHYRGRSIADKVRAGFRLFTPHGEADRLRRVLDQHELTADILSL